MNEKLLLEVEGLKTHYFTDEGVVRAVNGVDFSLSRGETLCLVGESGCGKSVTARSILRLIESPGKIVSGSIRLHRDWDVVDITALDPRGREMRDVRGGEISMIFQEPMTSLSPIHTIGDQVGESVQLHLGVDKKEAGRRAIEMLGKVGIPQPERRLASYPFELSGGMRQRVMIAIALSCNPSLLIADEPTTALDVTTQATILDLIKDLQRELGMAVLFITHDLGVVAEIGDSVAVMYLGNVVEHAEVDAIFHDPKHPYTKALLRSIPTITASGERLESIQGMVPHPFQRPTGCAFHPRCEQRMDGVCNELDPPLERVSATRGVRCLLYSDIEKTRERAGVRETADVPVTETHQKKTRAR